jgi:hypothetical protein
MISFIIQFSNDKYIGILPCDYSLPTLFDLRFLAGRDFSEAFVEAKGSGENTIHPK